LSEQIKVVSFNDVYKWTMICGILLQVSKRSNLVSEVCASLATGIALLALLGWISGARFLAGQFGTYIPMAPSTALTFLLLGSALFRFAHLPLRRFRGLLEGLAVGIVLLIGLFVLAQFIFGIDFGIERVLSRTNELLGSTPLGRMSHITAVAFLLEGAALLILLLRERWRNAPTAVAVLAAGAIAIHTVVLIGYVFGAPLLYGGPTIPVALPAAIAFVLVGLGQFNLAAPGVPALREWSGASMRGILLRAFLPFLLFFILLDSWTDLAFAPMMKLNPAVWYSLKVLAAGALIVFIIAWIARRTGGEIERAQKARAESEARIRHLFTTSPDAILLIDPHHPVISWPIVDCNEAACQMNAYAREDLIGQSIDILNVARGTKQERDAYLDRLRREGVIHIETLHRHNDGHTFPVEVSTSLFAFEGRELIVGIDRDITERKHAEQTLEERVKQLTALHEIAVTSTQVDSVDGLIESATEIIGKNLYSDNFGILLMDEKKGVLYAHPSYRFVSIQDLSPAEVSLGQGVTGQVAQTGLPFRIGNVEGLKNYVNVDPRTSSEMCVPITFKETILGVINAESTKPDAFSFDDELLLGTVAGQLATAIEQIRTAEAEHQWLDQLAHSNALIYAIAHITTHIEKALTQEEIIQTLGRELSKIDLTCCMATHNKERSTFTVSYTSMELNVLDQMGNRIGFPLIKHTFSLEKLNSILNNEDIMHPVAITNPENEIQVLFRRRREEGVSEILHEIGVIPGAEPLRLPLVFEENLLGILWVWGMGVTKADLPIMSIFAKQIGSSLERARLFQEVQSLALTDPLTGLQNRRSLFELGKIEFSRSHRTKRAFCCMMLDLDHFKQINDNYGHPVGDQVLQEFAERCKCSVRDVDLIGRYGGEEILIFLPETDSQTAMQVAERLRASIDERPMIVSGQNINITVSIGVSGKDENTLQLETLIARADQALYIAKHKGRNCVAISK
jgi:diguanylate cyclase (GGDEF)-like protein/PAS domain S-box-containing protein